jgi:hypothetical protein
VTHPQQAGTAIFPNEPYMAILNANFLMEVKGGYQTGYSQLMTAKKLRPHAWLQYLIFVRYGKSADSAVRDATLLCMNSSQDEHHVP